MADLKHTPLFDLHQRLGAGPARLVDPVDDEPAEGRAREDR